MTDTPMNNTPSPETPQPQQPGQQPAPVPRPRRRRRLLTIVGILLALLILLVVFLPTIASTGPVRSMIVGQINKQLDGNVQIGSWSLGWTSGIALHDVRVRQNESQILEAKEISTDLDLWNVVTGNMYKLGKTTVKDLSFVLVRYPDGTNNFTRLLKLKPDPNATLEVPQGLQVQFEGDFRGSIEQRFADGTTQVAYIDRSTASANITDINGKIASKLNLAVRDPSGQTGTIALDGNVRLFDNGKLALGKLSGNQSIDIKDLRLAAASPLLPPGMGIDTLTGKVDGKLTLKMQGENAVVADGAINIAGFSVSGPAMAGDTYKSSKVVLSVAPTTLDRAGNGHIAIGDAEGKGKIGIEFDQGSAYITGQSSILALQNMAANKAPGDKGRLGLGVDCDLAALAQQLPNVLKLRQGLKLTSGRFQEKVDITLLPDKAVYSQKSAITRLAGQVDGRTVSAKPFTVSASAEDFGGGKALPDLRNLSLTLDSAFADFKGSGPNLSQFKLNGDIKLAGLYAELGQFVDFARMGIGSLSGDAGITLTTATDPAKPDSPTAMDLKVTTSKLSVQRLDAAGKPLPLLSNYDSTVLATATYARQADAQVVDISALNITDSTGMITVQKAPGTAMAVTLPAAGGVAATGKLLVKGDLMQLSDFLAGMRAPGAGAQPVRITGGKLDATVDLSQSAAQTALALDASINGLSMTTPGQPIRNENLTVTVRGSANPTFSEVSVPQLDVKSSFVNAQLDQPLAIKQGAGGADISGAIRLTGQLTQVCALAEAFQVAAPGTLVNYAGAFDVRQKIATSGSQISADGQATITDLVVGDPGKPSFSEPSVQFTNAIRVDQAQKLLEISKLTLDLVKSRALNLAIVGKVAHYDTLRDLDGVKLTLGYDLAALYSAARPLIESSLKPEQRQFIEDLKVAGVRKDIQIPVAGRYPTPAAAGGADPIKLLSAQAVIGFDSVEYQGMTLADYDLPVSLSDGVIRTIYPDKQGDARFAKPAKANQGEADFSGLELSLAGGGMHLTAMRQNYPLLKNVNINEALLASLLGKISPIFYGTQQAKGYITFTVNQVQNMPLDAAVTSPTTDPNAVGKFSFSIDKMGIQAPFIDLLASQLGLKSQNGMVPMEVRDGTVDISRGLVTSDMKLDLGGQVIHAADASIRLADLSIQHMNLEVPKALIPVVAKQDLVKDVITVPVTGSVSAPKFDVVKTAMASIDIGAGVGKIIGGDQKGNSVVGGVEKIIGAGTNKGGDTTKQAVEGVGDLLQGLLGDKKEEQKPTPQKQPNPKPKAKAPTTRPSR